MLLTDREHRILTIILSQFQYMIPPGHPEWYDLTERTKLDTQTTLAILAEIKDKMQ
jgi:hypothetical protein